MAVVKRPRGRLARVILRADHPTTRQLRAAVEVLRDPSADHRALRAHAVALVELDVADELPVLDLVVELYQRAHEREHEAALDLWLELYGGGR